mmetsp:Transcript_17259/g.42831  ORF Transcript_17259/g.42831 Transcript_17259/m.42831 type:complete len:219 (-) Transcript_17259:1217-1873(-)
MNRPSCRSPSCVAWWAPSPLSRSPGRTRTPRHHLHQQLPTQRSPLMFPTTRFRLRRRLQRPLSAACSANHLGPTGPLRSLSSRPPRWKLMRQHSRLQQGCPTTGLPASCPSKSFYSPTLAPSSNSRSPTGRGNRKSLWLLRRPIPTRFPTPRCLLRYFHRRGTGSGTSRNYFQSGRCPCFFHLPHGPTRFVSRPSCRKCCRCRGGPFPHHLDTSRTWR